MCIYIYIYQFLVLFWVLMLIQWLGLPSFDHPFTPGGFSNGGESLMFLSRKSGETGQRRQAQILPDPNKADGLSVGGTQRQGTRYIL
jgi:hypothetical protein